MRKKGNITKDLTGKKFGKLQPYKVYGKRGKSSCTFWHCKCDCGGEHIVSSQHLTLGHVKKCKNCKIKSDEQLLEEAKNRFFENIENKEDCWIWKGAKTGKYGVMFFKKTIKSHRFSYLIHKGKLEEGKCICHTCDNPLCVNPDHLYQGTSKDNSRDAVERRRLPMGSKSHFSKLTEDQVKEILTSNEKQLHLAEKYKVCKNTINDIKRRRSWKYVS